MGIDDFIFVDEAMGDSNGFEQSSGATFYRKRSYIYVALLLVASATQVPPALTAYLSDIQPAYSEPQFPPVRGAYNHGWLIGGESAVSSTVQAEIDSMLEIRPQARSSEEQSVAQVE